MSYSCLKTSGYHNGLPMNVNMLRLTNGRAPVGEIYKFRRPARSVGSPMPAASKPPSTAIVWPVM